jgi:hypothetical protein
MAGATSNAVNVNETNHDLCIFSSSTIILGAATENRPITVII